ncbi:MAG: hypothetical protein J6S57_00500 [Alphaproteobacteria bacterium]|nr:hypothetical protein [Alphaproteobacteria bacterium]
MKSSLKSLIAVTASVMSTGAIASNLENPLYMPQNREVYLKTGAAMMYKTVEGTTATEKKGASGSEEFPVWRFTGDLGYGITDRLDIHGDFGYTKDGEIDRKGMHRGRIGMMLRALTEEDPLVLDLYADAYLSGITPMKGTYTANGFNFANYSNGRWGAIVGTRFGKTWDDFTLAAHVEYLQTFGNHNNKIAIDPAYTAVAYFLPSEISVDLKSTHETTVGFDAMYQMNSKWSFGAGFEYIEHYDNGVKGIHTQLEDKSLTVAPGVTINTDYVVQQLLAATKDMNDGWDEYVIKTNAAYQYTDDIQFTVFFEYTIDDAHSQSQNATDCKMELGVRLNARF